MPVSDVIDISSDSDDDALHRSFASSQSQSSSMHELVVISDDEDDLPAPNDPAFFQALEGMSKAAGKRKRHSRSSSSSLDHGMDFMDEDEHQDWEEEEDESPKKIARKASSAGKAKASRKPRKTEEDKAAAKSQKETAAAAKKAQKDADKAAKAAQTAHAKAAKKAYLAVNKLVIDKKTTLPDIEILFPPSFDFPSSSTLELLTTFRTRVAAFGMRVSVATANPVRGCDVFQWKRTTRAEYDEVGREWVPFENGEERVEELSTYLVYMSPDALWRCVQEGEDGLQSVMRRARAGVGAGVTGTKQIFLMVPDLKAYYRRKGNRLTAKPAIERALAALQLAEHIHVLLVEGVPDAVERLYDLCADLGVRAYKLIQRSHLPFCSDTQQKTGTNLANTWAKMLEQIHRVTEHGARGIADNFPTANALFGAYCDAPDGRARDALVAGCRISHRADGAAKARPVGAALSQLVGTVMYGTDPLQLAYKAAKTGEGE
ncbi:hypothetical protein C8R45DRAFT_1212775 [Mycena sanguinolenta]|nr:hypothetical protein C8R45DRAFT_1212775 [Mycena sanguinolenta]